MSEETVLRRRVLKEMRRGGVVPADGSLVVTREEALSKDAVRQLHDSQRQSVLQRNANFLEEWESDVLDWFADGSEIDPSGIDPYLVEVKDEFDAAIFRYACLLWSVPVSQGFGRRTRFLLMDGQNEKLIGIFALGDPVYNLRVRDKLIGWNVSQRNDRLYSVLDAFVMGAVPPYNQLIAGKLVAMSALSDETLGTIEKKYKGRITTIEGKVKKARPVLITTTSALGRSSIYNRLRYKKSLLYKSIGYTEGWGHFHFSANLFEDLSGYLERDGGVPSNRYGKGPNWRIRTLRQALTKLDLDPGLLRHGVRREVFIAPTASNWDAYLRGEAQNVRWNRLSLDDMSAAFRDRWAIPRSERKPEFKLHDKNEVRSLLRQRNQEGA